jgi:hypothetical protein
MLVTAFRVLAPFSAYIKALKIVGGLVSKTPQFDKSLQLNFRTLQHLYFDDDEGRCKDFMVQLLNAVQISGTSPVSYHIFLRQDGFSTLLRHSTVRNAVELNICSRKVSMRMRYRSTDVLNRLPVRSSYSDSRDRCNALFAISHHVKHPMLFVRCRPSQAIIFERALSKIPLPDRYRGYTEPDTSFNAHSLYLVSVAQDFHVTTTPS